MDADGGRIIKVGVRYAVPSIDEKRTNLIGV